MNAGFRIVWVVRAAKLAMASYRLRCLVPAIYLSDLGWQSIILEKDESLDNFVPQEKDILIIIKDLSPKRLDLARRFREKNLTVIYDLCDPIFFEEYRGGRDIAGGIFLKDMLGLAHYISTSSPSIATGLRHICGYSQNVFLIRDAALKPLHVKRLMNHLQSQGVDLGSRVNPSYPNVKRSTIIRQLLLRRLLPLNFWRLHPLRHRIVWFGKSGGEYDNHADISIGFRALCHWREELSKLNEEVPIELAIMSNSSLKNFRAHFSDWPFPVTYSDWSMLGFQRLMQSADLALVPVGSDHIAQCSSGNRITQALAFRVPVICDKLQGLEPLYPYLGLDGILKSGKTYLTDPVYRRKHLDGARKILYQHYSPQSIARTWDQLFQRIATKKVMEAPLL